MIRTITLALIMCIGLVVLQAVTHDFRLGTFDFRQTNLQGLDKTVELISSKSVSDASNENKVNQSEYIRYQVNVLNRTQLQLADQNGKIYWTKVYPELKDYGSDWGQGECEIVFPIMGAGEYEPDSEGNVVLWREKGNRSFIWDKEGNEVLLPENSQGLRYYGHLSGHWVFQDIGVNSCLLQIYNSKGQLINTVPYPRGKDINELILSPNLKYFIVAGDKSLRFYTIDGVMYKEHFYPSFRLTDYKFSDDGEILLSYQGAPCSLIDMSTGEALVTSDSFIKFTNKDVGIALLYHATRTMIVDYFSGEILYAQFWFKDKLVSDCTLSPDGTEFSWETNAAGKEYSRVLGTNLIETYRLKK